MSREFSLKQKKKEELIKLVLDLEKEKFNLFNKIKGLDAEYKIRLNNYRENFEIVLPARQNGKTKMMRWKLNQVLNEKAIEELEKVNEILTDTIIDITKDEFDLNKLCYLEEISAEFQKRVEQRICLIKSMENY